MTIFSCYSEFKGVPPFCWSWSEVVGFYVFCRGRLHFASFYIIKQVKQVFTWNSSFYRVETWTPWLSILVKIQLDAPLNKVFKTQILDQALIFLVSFSNWVFSNDRFFCYRLNLVVIYFWFHVIPLAEWQEACRWLNVSLSYSHFQYIVCLNCI